MSDDRTLQQLRNEGYDDHVDFVERLQRENAEIGAELESRDIEIVELKAMVNDLRVSLEYAQSGLENYPMDDEEEAMIGGVLAKTPAQSLHDFCAKCTSGERSERDIEVAERVFGYVCGKAADAKILGNDVLMAITLIDLSEAIKDA